ncbi:MAG: hypothetical protein H0Z39_03550 [Peptococcaceae bacterium]|nr:hypothetical protein [Peptococcaceae bacterium]
MYIAGGNAIGAQYPRIALGLARALEFRHRAADGAEFVPKPRFIGYGQVALDVGAVKILLQQELSFIVGIELVVGIEGAEKKIRK